MFPNHILRVSIASGALLASLAVLSSCKSGSNTISPSSGAPIATSGSEADILIAEAQNYAKAGKTKRALGTYHKVKKKFPHSAAAAEAQHGQARLLDQKGDLVEAFEVYQVLISSYPSSKYYGSAIKRQEQIAHSVADGIIKNNFLGLKTKISPNKTINMLTKVRNNAPAAPSASRAQLAIGKVSQQSSNISAAMSAYKTVGIDYPHSAEAPEALFLTGELLVKQAEQGNQNKAHVNRARRIYQDLISAYPSHKRASDAKQRLAVLGGQDVQRSYDTAEFYRKKGKTKSALFYYQEVLRQTPKGSLHNLAKQRVTELGG